MSNASKSTPRPAKSDSGSSIHLRGPVIVSGTFDADDCAAKCVIRLSRLSIAPNRITVSGANSTRLLAATEGIFSTHREGKYIMLVGVSGAVIGSLLALWMMIFEPPWGLLKGLGLLSTAMLGAVIGCMFGSLTGCLIGSIVGEVVNNAEAIWLPTERTVIAVWLEEASHAESIKELMAESGATGVSVKGRTGRETAGGLSRVAGR